MEEDKYVYQYTSIETLALILEHLNIKFNSLQYVDDVEEVECDEVKDVGKFIFVSCWTKYPVENIALWNMYTPDMKGIRLRMPIQWFDEKNSDIKQQLSDNKLQSYGYKDAYDCQHIIYKEDIRYCHSGEYKKSIVTSYSDGDTMMNMFRIGRYKNELWKFQNEYRYIIKSVPVGFKLGKTNSENLEQKYNKLNEFEPNDKHKNGIFVKINPEKLNEIEIVLGPKCTEAHKLIVDSLLEKYSSKYSAEFETKICISESKNSKLRIK